jgi:hypothetical protein
MAECERQGAFRAFRPINCRAQSLSCEGWEASQTERLNPTFASGAVPHARSNTNFAAVRLPSRRCGEVAA